ncbi:MAG TPA: cell division protein FtsA [Bryobacteraceae bacterium]|nr:cell division protein FtsA [Bryobacteraceae bacterium]
MADKSVYAVGIDAGSARTRCLITLLEDERMRVLGWGEAPSDGWSRGRISDQDAVSDAILKAVREAEARAETPVDSAVLGVGGRSICGATSRGGCEMNFPRQIEQNDVDRAVGRASRVQLQEDEMLLHLFPQDFKVDGHGGARNPRGLIGSHLEVYVHLVTASAQEHNALVGAANTAHLAVEETVFEPVAAAYAAVLPEDRDEGVVLVDIGAHTTEIAVYYGEALVLSASLPICGDNFTRDVARRLYVGLEDAEMLKREYGCALLGLTADHNLFEVPSSPGRPAREATRSELNEILEARALELFEFVEHELVEAGLQGSVMTMVLTGGGARLEGMCDAAERVLKCRARIGLVEGIGELPAELNNASWTTCAGLAMYSARLKYRALAEKRKTGLWNKVLGG